MIRSRAIFPKRSRSQTSPSKSRKASAWTLLGSISVWTSGAGMAPGNVASATLIGCAILVGGVGAFRGVHEMLRREVICDDYQPSERLSPASSEDASRWRGTGAPLSASRHVEGVPLNPDDSCMRHGRDRTRRLPGRGLEHTAGVGDDSHSDRIC